MLFGSSFQVPTRRSYIFVQRRRGYSNLQFSAKWGNIIWLNASGIVSPRKTFCLLSLNVWRYLFSVAFLRLSVCPAYLSSVGRTGLSNIWSLQEKWCVLKLATLSIINCCSGMARTLRRGKSWLMITTALFRSEKSNRFFQWQSKLFSKLESYFSKFKVPRNTTNSPFQIRKTKLSNKRWFTWCCSLRSAFW